MMRRGKRVRAALAAVLMAASLTMTCVPVWATEGEGGTTQGSSGGASGSTNSDYTAVPGTTTTFTKHLVMDSEANTPNATFEYTLTAGTAISKTASNNGFEILAGINPIGVVMKVGSTDLVRKESGSTATFTLQYSSSDTNSDGVTGTAEYTTDGAKPAGHSEAELDEGEKCVWKTITVDFSACEFDQPGVYRYVLKESATTNQGITNDSTATRYIDVYVVNDETVTGGLKVESYTMHTEANKKPATQNKTDENGEPETDANGTNKLELTDKSTGYVNTYDTSNLTFRKAVEGNQASKDKYFKFNVTISNAVPGTVYTVDISSASKTTASKAPTASDNQSKSNITKITMPDVNATEGYDSTTGKSEITTTFYLKDDQEITIKGLAKGTKWTIVENPEDYDSTPNNVTVTKGKGETEKYNDGTESQTENSDGAKKITGTVNSADQKTSYTNDRSGTIPTGVILTIAPFAAAVLIGGLGLVVIMIKKKRAQEN